MSERKSPTQSATLYTVGTKKKGNDGNTWIVTEMTNGVKRWKLYVAKQHSLKIGSKTGSRKNSKQSSKQSSKTSKSYYTHDNGGRPFKVVVDGKNVSIFQNTNGDQMGEHVVYEYNKFIKKYLPIDIFIGKAGNSILLKLSKLRYVFIGRDIYEFDMTDNDEIIKYYSKIGNSDVPYPVIVGKNNVYFMLDRTFVNKNEFPNTVSQKEWEDAYGVFYYDYGNKIGGLQKFAKKIKKVKYIKKQLW